jgi:hypothetical protein
LGKRDEEAVSGVPNLDLLVGMLDHFFRTIDGMDSRLGFAQYKSRGKLLFANPHQGKE